MSYSFTSRTKFLSFCILAFACILIVKLFYVQVIHTNFYAETADRQYATPSSDVFERGTIFFTRRDGQLVSAAGQISGYKIAINPSKINDEEFIYNELSKIIPIEHDDFINKANKKSDPYEEIGNHYTKEEVDSVSQ